MSLHNYLTHFSRTSETKLVICGIFYNLNFQSHKLFNKNSYSSAITTITVTGMMTHLFPFTLLSEAVTNSFYPASDIRKFIIVWKARGRKLSCPKLILFPDLCLNGAKTSVRLVGVSSVHIRLCSLPNSKHKHNNLRQIFSR